MQLNDLLVAEGVTPGQTLVLRHRPTEQLLRQALPTLAGERRNVFDVYQAYQGEKVERSILQRHGGWVASFISYGAAKAVLVGLYRIDGHTLETEADYWAHPENRELESLGQAGFVATPDLPHRTHIHLTALDALSLWSGKLVVGWPPPERSWYRRAERNVMPVLAIREESAFAIPMPAWDQLECAFSKLAILPSSWQAALAQWRGIYSIFDVSDGRRYVGSAYGAENLLGRWMGYAASGHGGNKLLRRATRRTSDSRFCSGSPQTWTLKR